VKRVRARDSQGCTFPSKEVLLKVQWVAQLKNMRPRI